MARRGRWMVMLLVGMMLATGLLLVGCRSQTKTRIQRVRPQEAYELLQAHQEDPNFVVLDIRTPQEFQMGHLPGAINIDFYAPDFEEQLDRLDKTKTYLVYCRTGNRSSQALPILRKLGFQEVYELSGGIVAWVQANLPVTMP